jgi:hypothetical protein
MRAIHWRVVIQCGIAGQNLVRYTSANGIELGVESGLVSGLIKGWAYGRIVAGTPA